MREGAKRKLSARGRYLAAEETPLFDASVAGERARRDVKPLSHLESKLENPPLI